MPTIECTLHGRLEDSLPKEIKGNQITLSFDAMPSVDEIMSKLNIDQEFLQFALANGKYIEIEKWSEPITTLSIQFWPRISGG